LSDEYGISLWTSFKSVFDHKSPGFHRAADLFNLVALQFARAHRQCSHFPRSPRLAVDWTQYNLWLRHRSHGSSYCWVCMYSSIMDVAMGSTRSWKIWLRGLVGQFPSTRVSDIDGGRRSSLTVKNKKDVK
jgi:hypothetical protein